MTRLYGLVVCAAVLAACSNQATALQTASRSPVPPTPSIAVASPAPTAQPTNDNPLSLAAIQRVDLRTGFITGWTGTGLGLASTLDSGATWQRITVPTARITALRFIDAKVGWAGGFIPRDVPQVACEQAPPTKSSSCYGVVLRTVDGGRTWQTTLAIVDGAVYGDPVKQIQAIDGQVAWSLTLAGASPPAANPGVSCPTDLRRTTDGGNTWTTLVSGQILSIRFATDGRGWLAIADPNGSFEIRFTNDGGSTWNRGTQTSSEIIGLDSASTQIAWFLTREGGYCSSSTWHEI